MLYHCYYKYNSSKLNNPQRSPPNWKSFPTKQPPFCVSAPPAFPGRKMRKNLFADVISHYGSVYKFIYFLAESAAAVDVASHSEMFNWRFCWYCENKLHFLFIKLGMRAESMKINSVPLWHIETIFHRRGRDVGMKGGRLPYKTTDDTKGRHIQ